MMTLSVKRVVSLLGVGLAALLANEAEAEQIQHPMRLRIDSEMLATLFHRGDQRMLNAF